MYGKDPGKIDFSQQIFTGSFKMEGPALFVEKDDFLLTIKLYRDYIADAEHQIVRAKTRADKLQAALGSGAFDNVKAFVKYIEAKKIVHIAEGRMSDKAQKEAVVCASGHDHKTVDIQNIITKLGA